MERGLLSVSRVRDFRALWTRACVVILLLAAVFVTTRLTDMEGDGPRRSLGEVLQLELPPWIGWMITAMFVIVVVEPVGRARISALARMAVYTGLAVPLLLVNTAVHLSVHRILGSGMNPQVTGPLWKEVALGTLYRLPIDAIIFLLIVWVVRERAADQRLTAERTRALTLSRELVEARLRTLQMQLHPHFFFNAMNSVAMLVRRQENNAAVRTIASLSDLLRDVLRDHDGNNTLRDEMAFVERYLSIEQVRFHDRLRVSFEIPDNLAGARVPRLILQPLVENAVRHGVEKSSDAGRIELSARQLNSKLEIRIADDGPGPQQSSKGADANRTGLGLENVRNRLDLLFGDDASLELRTSASGGGTEAIIAMPLQFDGRNAG